jgi:hypothetical protein
MTRINKLTPDLKPDQLRSKSKEISERLKKATNINNIVKSKMVAEIIAIQHSLSGVLEKTLSNSQINSKLIQIETTLNRFEKNQLQTLLTEELTELLTKNGKPSKSY